MFSHSFTLHFPKALPEAGRCQGLAAHGWHNPSASKDAVPSWYPTASPKLVTSLRKTDSGLPEDKSKVILMLLDALLCPAECGNGSEHDEEVLGTVQPGFRRSSPLKSILSQKIGAMVTSILLSFVPVLCYSKPKLYFLHRFHYISICNFTKVLNGTTGIYSSIKRHMIKKNL